MQEKTRNEKRLPGITACISMRKSLLYYLDPLDEGKLKD